MILANVIFKLILERERREGEGWRDGGKANGRGERERETPIFVAPLTYAFIA